ncbi:MAG: RNA polymerase factor sigma-54 [Gemmatimonadaceae bacterium]|nr:RNA polymerase factor sigma-54 [Gemmatimonadaceae bacterium]
MKQGFGQHLGMRQEMRINPRLYQAMDLLYMPLLELQQHLKTELEVNPFLELIEPEEDEAEADEELAAEEPVLAADTTEAPPSSDAIGDAPDTGEQTDWDEYLNAGDEDGGVREEREEREWLEPVSVAGKGLGDHLAEQIALLELSDRERNLAEEFIGDIGDDGYLVVPVADIIAGVNRRIREALEAAGLGLEAEDAPYYTEAEGERMLAVVQGLDPAGVGARDLRECLLLQLTDQGRGDTLAAQLVRDGFDDLVARRWSELARRTGRTPTELQSAADELAKLDPKPGLRFSAGREDYIIPDLIVEKIGSEYRVSLNDAGTPRLRISRTYQDLARDKKKFDAESREFVATKLNAAQWMVQAIEQRRQTMLKVMTYIVDRQRDFFEKGVQGLKPLTLREVADVIGMHESTVSRVTNEKFAQTPRGVLPLKFFFSSGLSTSDGEDVSARAIKDSLQKLVAGEDPKKPYTDQEIVLKLKADGVDIARRTVAKYRDQLGILPARMRKRV